MLIVEPKRAIELILSVFCMEELAKGLKTLI
jgi:hypothetical protein